MTLQLEVGANRPPIPPPQPSRPLRRGGSSERKDRRCCTHWHRPSRTTPLQNMGECVLLRFLLVAPPPLQLMPSLLRISIYSQSHLPDPLLICIRPPHDPDTRGLSRSDLCIPAGEGREHGQLGSDFQPPRVHFLQSYLPDWAKTPTDHCPFSSLAPSRCRVTTVACSHQRPRTASGSPSSHASHEASTNKIYDCGSGARWAAGRSTNHQPHNDGAPSSGWPAVGQSL